MYNSKYKIKFHETKKGECPVQEFLDSLTDRERAKAAKLMVILSEEGPNLKRPYGAFLRDGIHELRIQFSKSDYRILYFFYERDNIIMTHGFTKKHDKVPNSEIDKALKYKIEGGYNK